MRPDSPDYIVDIAGLDASAPAGGNASGGAAKFRGRGKPWLAVNWRCCTTYSRLYLNRRGDAYEGACPKCGSPVRAVVGEGGTDARFFEAG
ncbi:MAG: hypothetical protein AAFX76_07940 [Planctomycetota bacterium]